MGSRPQIGPIIGTVSDLPAIRRLAAQELDSGVSEATPREGRFRFEGSLRTRTARGTLINSAFLIALSSLGLIKAFVLAGFLSQDDYGVWGILVVALGTLVMLKQVGINDKYIQQDDLDQEVAFQKAFTLDLLFSALTLGAVAALLPAIALLYGVPELILPGLAILLGMATLPFQAPLWVFQRRMEFVRQRALQSVDPVVSFVVSIVCAVAGAGYWAFVLGFAAGLLTTALAAAVWSPYPLKLRFDRQTLRSYFHFSWPLFAASGAALVASQGALLAARWELGLEAVGIIALASSLTVFTDRVGNVITATIYPAVCAVKDSLGLLKESFIKSNRLALMWAVPFGAALTLFAGDLVEFGIGDRWRKAIPVLQIFGVLAAINHVGFNWSAYFRARDETRPIAVAAIASTLVFVVIGLPLLVAYGLVGFAVGVGIQGLTHLTIRAFYLRRLFHGFGFLVHACRAFLPTVPAVAVVLVARLIEGVERSLNVALGELALYVLATLVATLWLESRLLREIRGYVLGRPRSAGAKA
jgi:O-antigen/teichoic acid export membrane protein